MATSYPGLGLPMYLASANPQEPAWANGQGDPVIPDGEYSIGVPLNSGMATDINVVFDAAPAGTAFNIWYSLTPDFADEYILQAITATADTVYTWTTNSRLSGFVRIENDGGQDINNAWLQQTAATWG